MIDQFVLTLVETSLKETEEEVEGVVMEIAEEEGKEEEDMVTETEEEAASQDQASEWIRAILAHRKVVENLGLQHPQRHHHRLKYQTMHLHLRTSKRRQLSIR